MADAGSVRYALPKGGGSKNCVTFLSYIGIPLWNNDGVVWAFKEEMIKRGAKRWRP
jgi:hypothetical protein